MGDSFGPSQKAIQPQKYPRRQSQVVDTPTARDDIYKAELKAAKSRCSEAHQVLLAAPDNGDADYLNACQKDVERATAHFTQVARRIHQERLDIQEKIEELELRERVYKARPGVARRVCTNYLADPEAPPIPVQDQVEGEALSANTIPESRSSPLSGSPGQLSIAKSLVTTPPPAPAEPSASTPSAHDNRRLRSSDTEPLHPNKRKRRVVSDVSLTDETITLNEVENGPKDYYIVYLDGIPYVLVCKEHGIIFRREGIIKDGDGVINSAQNHLRKHKNKDPHSKLTYRTVIATFGIRVLDCSQDDANRNNDFVLAKQNAGNGQSTRYRQSARNKRPTRKSASLAAIADDNTDTAPNTGRARPATIDTEPQPGEVWETTYDDGKNNAVLILPWKCSNRHGIPDWVKAVEDTDLINTYPSCYRYAPNSKTWEWAIGYRLCTTKGSSRKYPVIYFDDEYTKNHNIGWEPLSVLKPYNPRNSVVPYKTLADEYLRERGGPRRRNAQPTEGPVSNGVNITGDTSANEGFEVSYNRTSGTDYASPEERQSSITAGKQAIRCPVTVAPRVPFPDHDGLPGYEEPCRSSDERPAFNCHGDYMGVDSLAINGSADISGSTDSCMLFVSSTFQLSTNLDGHSYRGVEDLSVSDGAQAGPSSRSAVVKSEKRFKAIVQARDATAVAYDNILAGLPSTSTSAPRQPVSPDNASRPRLFNRSESRPS
ncbi:hypothetical protein ACHAP8_006928 [Fusarium lateritium]